MSSPAAQLAAIRAEVDPIGLHSPRKVRVALKVLGLEIEDLAPVNENDVKVSTRIPDAYRAEKVKLQRLDVWDGLRESRMEELRTTLAGLGPDDVRRYELTGKGIRAVRDGDLPEGEGLRGMEEFEDLQAKKQAKLRQEQQRKADLLVTGFLTEKKRMEEADAKIAAFEQRLAEKKRQQEADLKAKRAEAARKEERRQQQVNRAAQERRDYEDETDALISHKLEKAAQKRQQARTRDDLVQKVAMAQEKRKEAFRRAVVMEEEMLADIADRQDRLDARMEERHRRVTEEYRLRAEASQAKFQDTQLRIYNHEAEVAEDKLTKHRKFQDHMKKVRDSHELQLKTRSKSCGDIMRKAQEKWKSNYDKEMQRRNQASDDLQERHQKALDHVNNELKPLKLKCDNDIFTHSEVKYGTWGELQRKRYEALSKSRDAHTQALLFEIAEFDKKTRLQREGHEELERRRQAASKASLALKDTAREGFLKIQCEPDERKIHGVLTDLGFNMPTLPDEDDDIGPEEQKPAF